MAKDLQTFNFDTNEIRVIYDDKGEAWFVAADIAASLGIQLRTETLSRIPDAWKGYGNIVTLGGTQIMVVINQSAVYKLAFRSNKPEADRFVNWLAGEVLPALARTGSYTMPGAAPPNEPAITDARKEHVANLLELHFKVAGLFNVPAH